MENKTQLSVVKLEPQAKKDSSKADDLRELIASLEPDNVLVIATKGDVMHLYLNSECRAVEALGMLTMASNSIYADLAGS